jgi:Ni/Co efflux regulator RcnB
MRSRDRNRSWFEAGRWSRSYQAQHRYRSPWRYPSGWYAYRWSFGDYLPYGWYSSSYYLNWYEYGLPEPPIGAEWVRSGEDAILVDVWTGEVLSVYYGLFW